MGDSVVNYSVTDPTRGMEGSLSLRKTANYNAKLKQNTVLLSFTLHQSSIIYRISSASGRGLVPQTSYRGKALALDPSGGLPSLRLPDKRHSKIMHPPLNDVDEHELHTKPSSGVSRISFCGYKFTYSARVSQVIYLSGCRTCCPDPLR